ncbi:MAG TPA: hypothetical protein PKD91_07485 [Bacteroidia bacterium]|nr:hypothetical protein [Bacteroidia bacterium]
MEKEENPSDKFKLKMNLMVQNLLLTSLGMCKFAMLHEAHPMSQAIKQFKLFDETLLDVFIERVKTTKTGQTMVLSLEDEIMIYTAMDITCKAYLTDLGDELEAVNSSRLKEANSTFSEIRNTVLKGCQFVMEGMRETLSGYPSFDDRVDILDNYILV